MVSINKEQCIGCGACVKDCVQSNIKVEDKKAVVNVPCFLCGHCIAVCPMKAVSMDDYKMNEVVEYREQHFHVESENLLNMIKFRRSIRDFKDIQVEDEKLKLVLEAGRFTETGSNSQGVRFIVIQNELDVFKKMVWEEWYELSSDFCEKKLPYGEIFMKFYEVYKNDPSNDRLFFNAKTVLITAAEYPLDAGLASANMELMAASLQLGMLFDGFVVRVLESSEKIKKWLGLDGKKAVSCMLLGYPNVTYHRTVPRREIDVIQK